MPTGRKRPPMWVIVLVVAVVLAGAGFGGYQLLFAKGTAAAGECAAVEGADDASKLSVVGCGGDTATFKIASKKELSESGCPDGAYRELRDAKNLLCLMPNFVEGKCYAADDKNQAFRVAACDDPETIKIGKVIEGSDEPEQCPGGNGIGYPEPPIAFCIDTPGAS
ncbi:hypothetical protein [Alloactinosynnema sp. L-07]|nr:hypothetical protein [Alloactinosynnema sp. L-07]